MQEESKANMDPPEHLLVESGHLKDLGNNAFQAGDFESALNLYSEAICVDPQNYILYSNRSACHAKLSAWKEAAEDAQTCIIQNPEFKKGYHRLGVALEGLGEMEQAIVAYENVLSANRSDLVVKGKLASLKRHLSNLRLSAGKEVRDACVAERWSDIPEILKRSGHRVDLEIRDLTHEWFFERTPLLFAVARGPADIVTLLLQHGANPQATCNEGRSAVGWAIYNKRSTSLRALLDYGVPLHDKNYNLFQLCFNVSAESWNMEEDGRSCSKPEMYRMLLECGADPNAPLTDISSVQFGPWWNTHSEGFDPPIFAVPRHGYDLTKLMLDHGADPNAWNQQRSVLMQELNCVSQGYRALTVALLLIQRGATLTGPVVVKGKWPQYCAGIKKSDRKQLIREEKWYRRRHYAHFLSALRKQGQEVDLRDKVLMGEGLKSLIASFL